MKNILKIITLNKIKLIKKIIIFKKKYFFIFKTRGITTYILTKVVKDFENLS